MKHSILFLIMFKIKITYRDACYGTALLNLEKNLIQNITYKKLKILSFK